MSFLESLAIQISCHNTDITKVAYGSPETGDKRDLLVLLSQVKAEPHYKEIFVCKAMTVPENPIFHSPPTEKAVIWDCREWYLKRLTHQKRRNYFIIPKDLTADEVATLARVAIFSQIESTKKTKKYYCDLLECARSTFNDKYLNTLDLFCKNIDDKIHNIEVQAQKLRFSI